MNKNFLQIGSNQDPSEGNIRLIQYMSRKKMALGAKSW